jgi:hypothetical protein
MEPEMEVMAARIFRSGGDSPALTGLQKLRHASIYKAIKRTCLLIEHLDTRSDAEIADLCLCVKPIELPSNAAMD